MQLLVRARAPGMRVTVPSLVHRMPTQNYMLGTADLGLGFVLHMVVSSNVAMTSAIRNMEKTRSRGHEYLDAVSVSTFNPVAILATNLLSSTLHQNCYTIAI